MNDDLLARIGDGLHALAEAQQRHTDMMGRYCDIFERQVVAAEESSKWGKEALELQKKMIEASGDRSRW